MSFLGKEYTLDRQENVDGFLNSLGLPEDQVQAQLSEKIKVKVVKNGDMYTLTTNRGDQSIDIGFKSGVEFDEKVRQYTAKTTITVEGNTVTQVQKFDSDIIFTFKRVFSDNEVVLTMTSSKWDGVARRYFKA